MTTVLCGIIANDAARFSEFWSCVLRLKVPAGSLKDQVIGGDWCSARNELARRCIEEEYDYLWFMDDDHSFAPDLLQKLLQASLDYDLPIVNPLCTTRTAPFHLVTYAANPDPESKDRYLPISLEGLPGEGIVELEAGGCAGMLIRRDVLEATRTMYRGVEGEAGYELIEDQWFEYTDTSEDIVFCEKAKEAGFKLYADLSARLGHITTAVIMPGIVDDQWITGVTVGRDFQIVIQKAEDLIRQQEIDWVEEDLPPEVDEPHPLDFAGDMIVGHEQMQEALEPAPQEAVDGWCNEVDKQWRCMLTPGHDGPHANYHVTTPGAMDSIRHMWDQDEQTSAAERIEIWIDEEMRWNWRAIDYDGRILRKGSAVNEQSVFAQAQDKYPEVSVHLIQREVDDSRNLRPYMPPGRMWDRG